MSTKKTSSLTQPKHVGPNVNGCPDVQALIYSLNTAREKGALFFLAVQLAPILEGHCQKNEPFTPLELETFIAQATKAMVSQ